MSVASRSTQERRDLRRVRTSKLLARAQQAKGAQRRTLEEEIVQLNLSLAQDIAMRYRNRGIASDDLIQVAALALVKAVRRFDPDKATDFLSFAVPTIRGELRRTFRDQGWVVRPPRRIQELQADAWQAEAELSQSLNRSPRPSEIAAHLGVDEDEVREALALDGCFSPSSLDAPTGENGDGVLGERLGGADHSFDVSECRMLLAPAVRELSARDRKILELRYFQGWTQEQIGEAIGVTQMQVSRLVTRILRDLRRALDDQVSVA